MYYIYKHYNSCPLDIKILTKMIYLDKEFPYGAWTNDIWKLITKEILFNSDSYSLYLGISNEEIIGYCLMRKDETEYHIMKIVVDSTWQSNGLGTQLLDACVFESLDNNLPIVLEVKEDNEKAINLYRKFGFNVIEQLPEYYEDKSNAFKMLRIVK